LSLPFTALGDDHYHSILWSAITPLSELSVAANSQSIIVPDFTGGTWRKENPLEIMREV